MSNEQNKALSIDEQLDKFIDADELDIDGLLAWVRNQAISNPVQGKRILGRIETEIGGDIYERAAKEWASATAQHKVVPEVQPPDDGTLLQGEVIPSRLTAQGSPRPLPRRGMSGALTARERIDALIAKALDVAPKPHDRGEERAGSNPYRATEEPKPESVADEAERGAEERKPESEGKPEFVESPAIKWRPPVDFDEPIYDPGRPILSPGAGYDNAREFAGRECWRNGELVLFRWNGSWWRWDGRAYAKVSEDWMRRSVVKFLDEARRWETVKNGRSRLERFTPSKNQVTEALSMLESGLLLPDNFFPPMRLDDPEAEFGDVMIFKNGMVDLRTGKFVNPSPRLWVHGSVDYEWDPEARCPEWERHLTAVWPDDPESWECCEQFGGYGMTYDVSFQKGLLLVGAPRSGKGLLLRVMEWINGSSAVVAPNLATWLKGEKSTQGLIGKKWIVFPDMRLKPPRMYGQNLDPGGLPHDSLAMLLSITSGDSVEIGQMWTQSWKGRLPGKVGIASNDVPNFNDPVLPTRLIKLAFEIGHLGTEDRELPDRLKRELPGIAQRFHRAYLRLLERGYFVQPRSSIRLEQQAAMGSDPFARFLLETYVPDPVGEATIGRIVFLRGQWCDEQGYSDNVKKSINNRTIQAKVRAVPGFAHVTLAPRPHGEYRSYLGLRAAKAGEAN